MYEYKYESSIVTIILHYVTSVYYEKGADTFSVYQTDGGGLNGIPAKFYDDFMNKLTSYIKSRNQ